MLRTTTAGLAARLDFTIDDIEDLRIAVGEASAMVLPEADAGHRPDLPRSTCAPGALTVAVERHGADAGEPDYDSFAWQVLTTLATQRRRPRSTRRPVHRSRLTHGSPRRWSRRLT